MIFCNLKGGLGNMLFQIAATFEFARKNNVDCSFPNLNSHLFYLEKEPNCNRKLINTDHYRQFFKNLKTEPYPNNTPKIKFPFHYKDLDIPNTCIIDGFFQSEKYFVNSRKKILDLFPNRERVNKVSIHIRRGDYARKHKFHNLLTFDYYQNAMKYFSNEKFIIFSDDLEWCKKNFVGERFSFYKGENDLEDLFVMSSCDHNIIANSSFSWWAAWINMNKNKKVIAPKQWVGPRLSHLDTSDLQCDSWIQL